MVECSGLVSCQRAQDLFFNTDMNLYQFTVAHDSVILNGMQKLNFDMLNKIA